MSEDTTSAAAGPGPRGIILYGPPASGKDTITAALTELDPRIRLFRRLKVGGGNTAPYRMITRDELDQRRAAGDIVWENDAYGNTYAVDRSGLAVALAEGIPVVHLGQPSAIRAMRTAISGTEWLAVELWCTRNEALRRLRDRGSRDIQERLRTWDETPTQDQAFRLDTTAITSASGARVISDLVPRRQEGTWTLSWNVNSVE